MKQKLTKEEVKRREEALVKEIIADMMDSHGGYEKPQVYSWEKALVKEIIADMMDSHGGYEKPQV